MQTQIINNNKEKSLNLNSERTVSSQQQSMLQSLILSNHLESAKHYHTVSALTWKEILMSAFTKGNREQFFSVFELLRKQEKLEFYLRVYFLIYDINPAIVSAQKKDKIEEREINCFKEFLDTKGADLAKTTEFLEFYALPFIKKPLEHATFKTLFSKTWVSNLKDKLGTYIQIEEQSMKKITAELHSQKSIPGSQSQYKKASSSSNGPQSKRSNKMLSQQQASKLQNQGIKQQQKFAQLERVNKQLFSQLELIKSKYQQLQDNHQEMIDSFNNYMMDSQGKWFDSYKELVKTAKNLLQIVGSYLSKQTNQKIQRKYIQARRKIDKYERFISKKLQDLMSLSQDLSLFDKPSMNQLSQYTMKSGYTSKSWLTNNQPNITNNGNNLTSYVQIDEYIGVNYEKLNRDFFKMEDSEKQLIVVGFCWRLIKAKSMKIRRLNCVGMVWGNVLGMGIESTNGLNKNNALKQNGKQKNRKENQNISNNWSQLSQTLSQFLHPSNSICLSVLQLLNYMKVDYYARQHFFLKINITPSLIGLMGSALASNSFQHFLICIDLVSTISVYIDYRQSLLATRLPIFLLQTLESYPKIFEEFELMELIMMTLINFSSFEEGLKMYEEYENIFSTLSLVYEQEDDENGSNGDIIMLVNGFYYTLLSNRRLWELAIESNMPEFVKYLLNEKGYQEHERQIKFIEQRLVKFCGDDQASKQNNQQQDTELFLVDGQDEDEDVEVIMEDEIGNLEAYIKGHELLASKYGLKDKEADQQEKTIQKINDQFTDMSRQKKQERINQAKSENQRKDEKIKGYDQENIIVNQKPETPKAIPQESRLKKPVEMKSEEIQVSMINLVQSKPLNPQQSSIKQEIFNSPQPKIIQITNSEEPTVFKNSKQAQFMGIFSSKQKNPTFAKNKTQPYDYSSPGGPMMENQNLPNFGTFEQQNQLGAQQKSRRKQILKQINEEIQIKKSLKAEKHAEKQGRIKSMAEKNNLFVQDNFIKQGNLTEDELELIKAARSNAHIQKNEKKVEKTPKEKEEERKAFESKPKINRTPPKEEVQ